MTNNAASAVSGTVLSDLGMDPTDIDIDDVTEGELRYLQKQDHLKKKKPFLSRKWDGLIDDEVTHNYVYSFTRLCSYAYSLTHSLTHLLTHSLTHSLTHLLTHSLTHSLTYSLAHSLTYSLTHFMLIHST